MLQCALTAGSILLVLQMSSGPRVLAYYYYF